MTTRIFLLGVVIAVLAGLVGCPPAGVRWARIIGGAGTDTAEAVIATADGGYALVGDTDTGTGSNGLDVYLVLCDKNGTMVDWNVIGGGNEHRGYDLQQMPDNGYLLAASYQTTSAPVNHKFWLLRTDAAASVTLARTEGTTTADEIPKAVDQTADGGYVQAGVRLGATTTNLYVVKWDAAGTFDWDADIAGASGFAVQQTADLGYMAAGWTTTFGPGDRDMYLVKLTAAGVLDWSMPYGSTGDEGAEAAQQTADGGYILAGESTSFSTDGNWDAYIVKTNAAGGVQWTRVIGGPYFDGAKDIAQTPDGGYIVVVETFVDVAGVNRDIQLIRLRADGSTRWTRTYGGSGQDRPTSVAVAHDGGFVIGGYTNSWSTIGDMDIYLIKTNPGGYAPATPSP
ncbi:MAG: hypothetical protein GY851_12245 [bacterium]|nr:hypothetical protein [bacterium]